MMHTSSIFIAPAVGRWLGHQGIRQPQGRNGGVGTGAVLGAPAGGTVLDLRIDSDDGRRLTAGVGAVVLAGYTGRAQDDVQAHIAELAELGVAPPPRVPMSYLAPPSLLSAGDSRLAAARGSSGEAEFVLLVTPDETFVSVGSDHTDRVLEALDVPSAKVVCGKVMADVVWPLRDVAGHWDALELRAEGLFDGDWIAAQECVLGDLLAPHTLLEHMDLPRPVDGVAIAVFGGTVPASQDLRTASAVRMTLNDPVRGRSLAVTCETVAYPPQPGGAEAVAESAAVTGIDMPAEDVRRLGAVVDRLQEVLM